MKIFARVFTFKNNFHNALRREEKKSSLHNVEMKEILFFKHFANKMENCIKKDYRLRILKYFIDDEKSEEYENEKM